MCTSVLGSTLFLEQDYCFWTVVPCFSAVVSVRSLVDVLCYSVYSAKLVGQNLLFLGLVIIL